MVPASQRSRTAASKWIILKSDHKSDKISSLKVSVWLLVIWWVSLVGNTLRQPSLIFDTLIINSYFTVNQLMKCFINNCKGLFKHQLQLHNGHPVNVYRSTAQNL